MPKTLKNHFVLRELVNHRREGLYARSDTWSPNGDREEILNRMDQEDIDSHLIPAQPRTGKGVR